MTSVDRARALLEEHAGEIRQRLDGLAAAVEAGDSDDALRRAHILKGSALALSLPDLAAAMERLEGVLREEPERVEAAFDALAAARVAVDAGVPPEDPVARLSHALRTPLSVVLGFAHLLRESDGLDPAARLQADSIVRAAEQMAATIDEATGVTNRAPASTPAGRDTLPVTVLYVEDDPASARLAEELLLRLPAVRAVVACTGADGLALAERVRPDLVLLDPGLPDISGDEMLRLLREAAPGPVPVIVAVTGDSRAERLQELLRAGAAECVVKPVDLGLLRRLVASVRPN